ncbi:Phosphatidylserine/phosphatidylglycerophosphate/cardiolipin synthase [Ferrithrix thermotolerans DSM 19514]|uniref:phospholipase D n=1 Tax=Ferrithrix thermotolerans DSM 19514 TaxID=1121881 RepID=A0A1M4S5E8_9ACTN|nr:phospholipase D-like domain-containing protein [Ferrithrix thermotolerans]SHE27409.1 Phosphatidylserine/phosphatidylglycerophosphate/cardiolipin synthase [Ferrithrix thermotolerans DSM 19514]
MKALTRFIFGVLYQNFTASLVAALLLSSCGAPAARAGVPKTNVKETAVKTTVTTTSTEVPAQTTKAPSQTVQSSQVSGSPGSSMTFLSEPKDGESPWLNAISSATSQIDANYYLLTDSSVESALISAASRGVTVDVIIDGNPFGESYASAQTLNIFNGTKVHIKVAPSRFEGTYSYDHAKYLLVDPLQRDAVAIFGSANATASAFDGNNIEDDLETSDPQIVSALYDVFRADWSGVSAGPQARTYLVLSPGSATQLISLIQGGGPIEIMTEELGYTPSIYQAIEGMGPQVRMLVPSTLSPGETSYVSQLMSYGVQIREISTPYLHAKLIVAGSRTFIGSQNFSEPSLYNNREVGVITSNPTVYTSALALFNFYWSQAQTPAGATTTQSLPTSSGTSSPPSTPSTTVVSQTSSYPYIPYGDSQAQVIDLWGEPSSTGTTTYDGYPETAWYYPGGTVYFGSAGTVVYVQRSQ